jgi:hemerythrin superfamily protein
MKHRAESHSKAELIRDLHDEHALLDKVFSNLVANASCDDRAGLRAAWETFERDLTAHMDIEERQLLPGFKRYSPNEARGLLEEHGRIRAALTEMGVDLDLHCLRADRVNALIQLIRAHAQREEALLYPWGARTRNVPMEPSEQPRRIP